jgi:hypothetical protein
MAGTIPPGEVFTFYSYKGGTGRSMLLANVAWQLASAGERVLIIDWDLEAPGVHRYFKPFLGDDPELRRQPGVMQWLADYWDAYLEEPALGVEAVVREYADPRSYVRPLQLGGVVAGKIDLLCAGQQDSTYAQKVADFDFTNLYERLEGEIFIDAAKAILVGKDGYDHVLVDSRTGVSDTSGFCTVALADTLIVCFTYNNQSVIGASQIARDIRRQAEARRAAQVRDGTARRFRLFAVPSRVVHEQSDRLEPRQRHAWAQFADLLTDVAKDQQTAYWLSVQIMNSSSVAYEEVLAACVNRAEDPQSVLGAVTRLTQMLTDQAAPAPQALSDEARHRLRQLFADLGSSSVQTAGDVTAWDRFVEHTPDANSRVTILQQCLPLLSQLVAPAPDTDAGGACVRTILIESDLTIDEQRMAETLTIHGLLQRRITNDRMRAIELTDGSPLVRWDSLREHMQSQGAFIAKRERLREARRAWMASGRSLSTLREMRTEFTDFRPDSQQRTWLGSHNLQFLSALHDLDSVERRHRERVDAVEGQLRVVQEQHTKLTGAHERSEAGLQAATGRSASIRTWAISTCIIAVVLLVIIGHWGNRQRERSAELREALTAVEQQRDAAIRHAAASEARLTEAQAARASAAASLHLQAGLAADNQSRVRGANREALIREAITHYDRAIETDPTLADAYRQRALARARMTVPEPTAELRDWAKYVDLRRSLSGRLEVLLAAIDTPGVDLAFLEGQFVALRLDAQEPAVRNMPLDQVVQRLQGRVSKSTEPRRSWLSGQVDTLARSVKGVELTLSDTAAGLPLPARPAIPRVLPSSRP